MVQVRARACRRQQRLSRSCQHIDVLKLFILSGEISPMECSCTVKTSSARHESHDMGAKWSIWSWCFQYLHQHLGLSDDDLEFMANESWPGNSDFSKGLRELQLFVTACNYLQLSETADLLSNWPVLFTPSLVSQVGSETEYRVCIPTLDFTICHHPSWAFLVVRNIWLHVHPQIVFAGWSSSKVLNFITTLQSHMNTTTLSKEAFWWERQKTHFIFGFWPTQ